MKKHVLIGLAFLAAACGSRILPSEIAAAEGLSKSSLSAQTMKLAPSEWQEGTAALEESRRLAKKGKTAQSRLKALEALIYFKTAIAVAKGKVAEGRIRKAKDDMAQYENEREKFATLRQDAEVRFLQIMAYHMEQKDEAFLRRSNFENEREKYLKLTLEEKEKWDKAHRPALEKNLLYAGSLVEAAKLITSRYGSGKAVQDEAIGAISAASDALDGPWETARPLVDEALMKAERLLEHQRIKAKPHPLENPASAEETLEMVKKNLEDKKVFVSASFKGILVSVENPWDGKKAELKDSALSVIEVLAGILKDGDDALVLIESYHFDKDAEKARIVSEAIGLTALSHFESKKLAADRVAAAGWGNAQVHDPGPCLVNACPGGRLDIVIVSY